jgi:hypothetical protein
MKKAKVTKSQLQRAAASSCVPGILPAVCDNMGQLAERNFIVASLQPVPGQTEASSSSVAADGSVEIGNTPQMVPRETLTPGEVAGDTTDVPSSMPAPPPCAPELLSVSQTTADSATTPIEAPCVEVAASTGACSALVLPPEATSCIEGVDSATVEPASTAGHTPVAKASPTASPIPPATSTPDGPEIPTKFTEEVTFDEQFWGSPPPAGDLPAWSAVADLAYYDPESHGFIPEDVLPEACWVSSARSKDQTLPFYSLTIDALECAYKLKTGQYELPDAAELVSAHAENVYILSCIITSCLSL